MDLPSKAVWDVLEDRGIDKLYHANSVITGCQFLRHRALLSRGSVERLKLAQSEQYSDGIDRRHSLWFDVFVDSVDIHDRARRANRYGPALFVLGLDKIRTTYTGRVWVTKINPTNWADTSVEDRWFRSKAELQENFVRGDFGQMIVFRHCGGALPIERSLQEIILDDPRMDLEGVDLHGAAVGALTLAMSDSGLNAPISRRQCSRRCTCRDEYRAHEHGTTMMFYPYT